MPIPVRIWIRHQATSRIETSVAHLVTSLFIVCYPLMNYIHQLLPCRNPVPQTSVCVLDGSVPFMVVNCVDTGMMDVIGDEPLRELIVKILYGFWGSRKGYWTHCHDDIVLLQIAAGDSKRLKKWWTSVARRHQPLPLHTYFATTMNGRSRSHRAFSVSRTYPLWLLLHFPNVQPTIRLRWALDE